MHPSHSPSEMPVLRTSAGPGTEREDPAPHSPDCSAQSSNTRQTGPATQAPEPPWQVPHLRVCADPRGASSMTMWPPPAQEAHTQFWTMGRAPKTSISLSDISLKRHCEAPWNGSMSTWSRHQKTRHRMEKSRFSAQVREVRSLTVRDREEQACIYTALHLPEITEGKITRWREHGSGVLPQPGKPESRDPEIQAPILSSILKPH